ncbi:response regulator [Geoalkalibacter sp.]|uniref:response regulator n=1 Tax=Geoalkalibacter sp. TaxID=3041440 RepID=UPI00272E661C|nr:response regulator [Geoalkalibacter sp.]
MPQNNRNILVVDDSPTVRRLSELILSQQGYVVHSAEDGAKGLALARETRPAAILVDFVMPNMNGQQFCRELRTDPRMRDIPVILISSHGEKVGQAFEKHFGVVHYFTKPFEPEDLVNKLAEVLREARGTADESPGADPAGPNRADGNRVALEDLGESFDRVLRRYLYSDFPVLMQRIFFDTLQQSGLVKKNSLILSGDLGEVPLPDLINFAYNSRLGGRLTIFSREAFAEVFVEEGCLVYANVSRRGHAAHFLTDLLAADGLIAAEDVEVKRIIAEAREHNVPVGQMLVSRGVIAAEVLMAYLRRQSLEAFAQILDVQEGNFFLEKESLPLNLRDISYRIPLLHVLMEGLRRLDEKQQAAVEFKDEELVLVRLITNDDALEPYEFSEPELKVFALIDGRKTLREVIAACSLDPREVKRICYALSKVNLLRVKNA